MGAREAR